MADSYGVFAVAWDSVSNLAADNENINCKLSVSRE